MSAEDEPLPPCLSVVMPCFNEAPTIGTAVARVLDLPFVAELIVVDDGSTDGTPDHLAAITDPRVRLLVHDVNQGKGAALRTGFAVASAPFVAVQDADLEYDPRELERLLGPLLDGRADVVYGSRFVTTEARRVLYFWHSLGNRLLTTLSNMTTNLNLTDMETCYKVFRREVLAQISIEEDRFGVEPELTAKVAALGVRVFEVGISYSGRSYAEGKKVGWRDGVHALAAIGKYAAVGRAIRKQRARKLRPFAESDEELAATLRTLESATNYRAWLGSLLTPHLEAPILEVGAGHGTYTELLADVGDLTVCEPSERAVEVLRERFASRPEIGIVHGELDQATTNGQKFGSMVMINVLEHIEDDDEALRQVASGLRPGGTVAIFTPAFELLYSGFDAAAGHHRRYRLPELRAKVQRAGFTIREARYVNSAGFVAWLLTARALGLTPTSSRLALTYDRYTVPIVRAAESRVVPPFGQSCLVIAER
jgi:2-polyprenyl-3-methyl-5-hydroxy-6-metoxy-1,4-benzoquinol methylase